MIAWPSRSWAGEGPDVFIIDDFYMDVEKLVRQVLLEKLGHRPGGGQGLHPGPVHPL